MSWTWVISSWDFDNFPKFCSSVWSGVLPTSPQINMYVAKLQQQNKGDKIEAVQFLVKTEQPKIEAYTCCHHGLSVTYTGCTILLKNYIIGNQIHNNSLTNTKKTLYK